MRIFTVVVLCIFFFLISFAYAQAGEQTNEKVYRNVKVKLTSGNTLKGNNLLIDASDSKFTLEISDVHLYALGKESDTPPVLLPNGTQDVKGPQSGAWHGTTSQGNNVDFTVSADGSKIEKFIRHYWK